jgi:hypothetical protein
MPPKAGMPSALVIISAAALGARLLRLTDGG